MQKLIKTKLLVSTRSSLQSFNSFMMGDRYHIETSPMICAAHQWTGFYVITASVMKELKKQNVN